MCAPRESRRSRDKMERSYIFPMTQPSTFPVSGQVCDKIGLEEMVTPGRSHSTIIRYSVFYNTPSLRSDKAVDACPKRAAAWRGVQPSSLLKSGDAPFASKSTTTCQVQPAAPAWIMNTILHYLIYHAIFTPYARLLVNFLRLGYINRATEPRNERSPKPPSQETARHSTVSWPYLFVALLSGQKNGRASFCILSVGIRDAMQQRAHGPNLSKERGLPTTSNKRKSKGKTRNSSCTTSLYCNLKGEKAFTILVYQASGTSYILERPSLFDHCRYYDDFPPIQTVIVRHLLQKLNMDIVQLLRELQN